MAQMMYITLHHIPASDMCVSLYLYYLDMGVGIL